MCFVFAPYGIRCSCYSFDVVLILLFAFCFLPFDTLYFYVFYVCICINTINSGEKTELEIVQHEYVIPFAENRIIKT